jgi:hypothetical protein
VEFWIQSPGNRQVIADSRSLGKWNVLKVFQPQERGNALQESVLLLKARASGRPQREKCNVFNSISFHFLFNDIWSFGPKRRNNENWVLGILGAQSKFQIRSPSKISLASWRLGVVCQSLENEKTAL